MPPAEARRRSRSGTRRAGRRSRTRTGSARTRRRRNRPNRRRSNLPNRRPQRAVGRHRRRDHRRLGHAAPPLPRGRAPASTCGELPAAQKRQGRSTAFVIPIRGPVDDLGPVPPRGRQDQEGVARRGRRRSARGRRRAPRSACPGPSRARHPAARRAARASSEPGGRLEGPDQHRGGVALRLGDEVEQAVDAVGEVDVGSPGRAEEGLRARRQADEGVAGRVVALVALGLDDRPAAPA